MFTYSEQEGRMINLNLVVSYYWEDDEEGNLCLEMVNGDTLLISPEELQGAGLPLPE
ncbi:MAG: hypothetical protein QW683_08650 [Candidatus Caldarchaeum sp.]